MEATAPGRSPAGLNLEMYKEELKTMLILIQNQRGSALVIALLMLIMLSFIGIASITTSVRDMDIAKNTTDRTDAFYVAEAGLEMAFGILKNNATVLANDSLMALMTPYTSMPNGS